MLVLSLQFVDFKLIPTTWNFLYFDIKLLPEPCSFADSFATKFDFDSLTIIAAVLLAAQQNSTLNSPGSRLRVIFKTAQNKHFSTAKIFFG